MTDSPLLELDDVHKDYRGVRALDGVTLSVMAGETLGIVGESGCGKSTAARIAVGLERPTSGEVRFRGSAYPRSPRRLRAIRRRVGISSFRIRTSLDPRFTLQRLVDEPLRAHGLPHGRQRIEELLTSVGMENADLDSYPGQYSGGQRQRIGIARALSATEPDLVVCDEPTSALDVSVQAQILNLLLELQRDRGLAYLFISHDLEVVRRMSDRLAADLRGPDRRNGPRVNRHLSAEPSVHARAAGCRARDTAQRAAVRGASRSPSRSTPCAPPARLRPAVRGARTCA